MKDPHPDPQKSFRICNTSSKLLDNNNKLLSLIKCAHGVIFQAKGCLQKMREPGIFRSEDGLGASKKEAKNGFRSTLAEFFVE
jgi:hypothetical protein